MAPYVLRITVTTIWLRRTCDLWISDRIDRVHKCTWIHLAAYPVNTGGKALSIHLYVVPRIILREPMSLHHATWFLIKHRTTFRLIDLCDKLNNEILMYTEFQLSSELIYYSVTARSNMQSKLQMQQNHVWRKVKRWSWPCVQVPRHRKICLQGTWQYSQILSFNIRLGWVLGRRPEERSN